MNYDALISTLDELHRSAQTAALQAVNRGLVLRNWLIGAYLVKYEQSGEDRAEYGAQLIETAARDLRIRGLKGLGVSMLRLTRRFSDIYPQIRQSAMTESPLVALPEIRQSLITESALTPPAPQSGTPTPLPAARVLALSWTHLIEFIRLDDPWKRAFYENECLKGGWSRPPAPVSNRFATLRQNRPLHRQTDRHRTRPPSGGRGAP